MPLGVRLAFLGLVNAMGAFSTDPYLPALPRMVSDLHTSDAAGQLSLTMFIVGLAIGQLVVGGICDSRGRRGPMVVGAIAYVFSAVACAVAPDILALLAFRFVQGAAAAAGIVSARAMVRDLVTGPKAATIFGRLFLVSGLAPIVSPVAGAGIERLGGWRAVFICMAVLGALLVIGVACLPETLDPQRRRSSGLRPVIADWRILLRDRAYVALVLTLAFAVAAMFGYVSAAPFILKDRFGLGPTMFALAFAFGAAGFIIGNLIGARIAVRFDSLRAAATGCVLLMAAAAGLCLVVALNTALVAFMPPVLVLFAGTGMVVPNTMGLALIPHPERAGSAAALLGVAQFVVPGVMAPIIGAIGAAGFALPAYEAALTLLAAGCLFVLRPSAESAGITAEPTRSIAS